MSNEEWKIGQIFVAFSEYLNFTKAEPSLEEGWGGPEFGRYLNESEQKEK